jgi:hypothetical protein
MTTRSGVGTVKLNPCYAGVSTTSTAISPILKTVHAALHDPHWRAAMEAEYNVLVANNT